MKKTLQINIAGVVFTIEEDAYQKLTAYLKSIEQYFSKYEDSREIVSDIETRVSEKFFNKQRLDNQTVITTEQVNQVVASMGSVADFEAFEEDEDLVKGRESEVISEESEQKDTQKKSQNFKTQDPKPTSSLPPQKYFRDTKRKALGGVLAGLAYHFKIDVVWLRLIFLLLTFGATPISKGDLVGLSAFLFIAYFVCWIAFPPNNNLEEDAKVKKLYRNPDQKVIGGVCSGLAAYFGTDLGVMRFIFVIMGFAGFGIIAYILLWIVAPKATTLTQKMEMKGEPVTLENIETNIKSNLNLSSTDQETPAAKILLLPFRIIATVLNVLGQVFKNLGPVVRVFAGIILLIISISWMFALIVGAAAFFGITSHNATDSWLHFGNIPTSTLARDIHPMLGVLGFLVFFLPAAAIGFIGLSLISTNPLIGNRTNWLTGLGLWIVSCLSFGTMIGNYMLNFSKHGEHEITKTYALAKNLLVLDAKEKESDFFDKISVNLEGYEGTELKLVETFKASGNSKDVAERNASLINYKIIQKDSSLLFDNEVSIPTMARFREQALEIKAYLPYNQPFTMTERFVDNLLENDEAIFDKYDLEAADIKKYRFVMKKDSGIICLNCSLKKENNDEDSADNDDKNDVLSEGIFAESAFTEKGDNERNFDLTNFQKIAIGGAIMVVNIKQGNTYKITVDSDEKDAIDDLNAKIDGNTLKIFYDDNFIFNSHDKQVRVNITMPKLEKIQLSGASLGKITGFNDKNDLEINLAGASRMALDVKVNKLTIKESGASKIELVGSAEKIQATISGASKLYAKDMKTTTVQADASGASSANFGHVSDFHANGASKITRE